MSEQMNMELKDLPTLDKQTGKRIMYVVYAKKERDLAVIAQTVISEKKEVKCSILDEDIFNTNYKISSENIILYLGDIKNTLESRKLATNARTERKYGVHYGWCGRHAFIWVNTPVLSRKEKSEFLNEYEKKFGELDKKYNLKILLGDVLIAFMFGLLGLSGKKLFKKYKISDKLSRTYIGEKSSELLTSMNDKIMRTPFGKNYLKKGKEFVEKLSSNENAIISNKRLHLCIMSYAIIKFLDEELEKFIKQAIGE